ncbi:MAG: GspE/PulE family protein [Azoarcus sp.]|jgi:general secretion pathway protein E|nr:GspE/PulE family protein [Azoarcus sp.]
MLGDLLAALNKARAAATPDRSVLDVLLEMGFSSRMLSQTLAALAGVPAISPESEDWIEFSALCAESAASVPCVPLRVPGAHGVCYGLSDPWDEELVARLRRVAGPSCTPAAVSARWLRRLNAEPAPPIIPNTEPPNASPGAIVSWTDAVVLVDQVFASAIALGASDIHFETGRSGLRIKFRVNGVLMQHARTEDSRLADESVSRIKVLAQLDITERRIPQDGRFRWRHGAQDIDMRVSIMPGLISEDAVLRILDKSRLRADGQAMSLDRLGLDRTSCERIRELTALPHGMLLVTGPTGSGKTTTLYAALSELNTGQDKIVTIEDPVEYELAGVLQIPVNERKGLTFARGLRSILRHDPDRILVGEIRDGETADIAVQSALTGHQVFTTVHANSVFDVVGRFKHFEIDMFGFMGALNGIVVQRLLREICPHCRVAGAPTAAEQGWLQKAGIKVREIIKGVGCARCNGTGYGARSAIAEVHTIDDPFRDLVISEAPLMQLRRYVQSSDAGSLSGLAGRWIEQGRTTPEEVRRVLGWL